MLLVKAAWQFHPDRNLLIEDGWADFRFFDDGETDIENTNKTDTAPEKKKLEPIQGWFKDSQGRMVLTAKTFSS